MNTFITTALPYANGDLHWGHFFEAVISDIYAKHKKIPLISGDDQHGAAITLFTEKNKLNIQEHLHKQYLSHLEQYNYLGVDYSYFGQTDNSLHTKLVLYFYEKLKQKGYIVSQTTTSWYDEINGQFLPDRYVRGQCPCCFANNVYPHVCEHCNQYFSSEQLINPVSTLSNQTPVLKETAHFFLKTEHFYDNLEKFCTQLNIHESVRKKILDKTLSDLNLIDITRDLPYFGINVPYHNLAFYVWFDAPIGYLSFILEKILQENKSLTFEQGVEQLQHLQLEHVIGKDITYFHTFFWLNLLQILDIDLPKKLHVHGWILQDNGEKYSKSNGDKLDLTQFSTQEIDAIRFYFASIYDKSIQDNTFSFKKAYETYNTFIVGKYINIYSRISKLLEKKSISSVTLSNTSHFDYVVEINKEINDFHLKNLVKLLFSWIDDVNIFIQEQQPWTIENPEQFIHVCYIALSEFKQISDYIGLICPYLDKTLKTIDYTNIKHIHLSSRIVA